MIAVAIEAKKVLSSLLTVARSEARAAGSNSKGTLHKSLAKDLNRPAAHLCDVAALSDWRQIIQTVSCLTPVARNKNVSTTPATNPPMCAM